MKAEKHHYDAWGNPIMDYFSMQSYYRKEGRAWDIVRKYLPHRYVVIPDVRIYINVPCDGSIRVWKLYPGGEIERTYEVSKRALEGLRTAYKGRGGGLWSRARQERSFWYTKVR